MVIKFVTDVDKNDKIVVKYLRDSDDGRGLIEIAAIETTKPLQIIVELLSRLEAEPHMIFSVETTIIGADIRLSTN